MEVNVVIASILVLLSISSCIATMFLAHYHMNTECEKIANPLLLCSMATIFLVSVIYGLLPYFYNKHTHHGHSDKIMTKSEIFVSLLNCFAGGIILGISILDIWNDTEKQFHKNFVSEEHYPWVKMLVGVGFLVMFLIDELVSSAFSSSSILAESGPLRRKMTIMNFDIDPADLQIRENEGDEATDYIREVTVAMFGHVPKLSLHKSLSSDSANSKIVHNPRKTAKQFSVESCQSSMTSTTTHSSVPLLHRVKMDELKNIAKTEQYKKMRRTFQITLVVSTFLFHSFLEGLALGIEWNPENVVHMFFIIVIHKSMLMWNAGVNLNRKFRSSFASFFGYLVLLSIVTPLGALVTYSIQRYDFVSHADKSLLIVVLHCFSISMFLFLAIFEIMAQEQMKKYSNFLKMIAYTSGFALIAGFVKILDMMHKIHEKEDIQPEICR